MPNLRLTELTDEIKANVRLALAEDIGTGDISASLVPPERKARARIISREAAVVCGRAWVDEVFRQLDSQVTLHWQVEDGQKVAANQEIVRLHGSAQALLSGERAALNFLQTLSAVATCARQYADLVEGTGVRLLDTRKTLPGLRLAQKYAVTCGGCDNHRIGLFDAFLIKENHIAACGSISAAVAAARQIAADKPLEVEVENLGEFAQALNAGADIIMLDELSDADIKRAVLLNQGRAKLEASGGVNQDNLRRMAQTGVDFISIGRLTKDIKAVDLSMRLELLEIGSVPN